MSLSIVPSTYSLSQQARLSYPAFFSICHRSFSTSAKPRSSQFSRSDFQGQPFTGEYVPNQPIRGPLNQVPLHGVPRKFPRDLKEFLDQHVVGQERPKKKLCSTVFNHYKRVLEAIRLEDAEQDEQERWAREARAQRHPVETEYIGQVPTVNFNVPIEEPPVSQAQPWPVKALAPVIMEKSNMLMLGPTGVGKSLMIKTIARILDVPFSTSDVTAMTQAGYIGQDVESCIERLLVAADYDVARVERGGIIFLDEIDKLALTQSRVPASGKDVGGEGVQQALLKILEGTTVQINARSERSTPRGPNSLPNGFGTGSGSSNPGAPKTEIFNVRTDNILFVMAGAFVGLDKIVLNRISRGSLGFGANLTTSSPSDSSSSTISPSLYRKHSPFNISNTELTRMHQESELNILDLVRPSDLKAYGLIPEFIGRVPVTVALNSLSLNSLVRILTEPRNSLVQQYKWLFFSSKIELHFTVPALYAIAQEALNMGTGARALKSVLEGVLEDPMFFCPGSSTKFVLVDEDAARKKCLPHIFSKSEGAKVHSMIAEEDEEWERKMGKRKKPVEEPEVDNYIEYRKAHESGA